MHRSTVPLTVLTVLFLAMAGAAWAQQSSTQTGSSGSGSSFQVSADGRAEGRFVTFDVSSSGAVCDWSVKGTTVLEAVAVANAGGARARAEGRAVVLDGDGSADPSCSAGASGGAGSSTPTRSASGTTTSAASSTSDDDDDDGQPRPSSSTTRTASATSTSAASTRTSGSGVGARVTLHDNPTGAIQVDLRTGQALSLDLAVDADVKAEDGRIVIDGDGVRASLFATKGDIDVRARGDTLTVTAKVDAKVHFRVEDRDMDDEDRGEMREHVDDGDVAAEVFVSDDDRPHVTILGAHVTVVSVHTNVNINLTIDIDLDGDGDGDGTATQTTTRTETQTVTRTETQTQTQTTTAGSGGGGGGSGSSTRACDTRVAAKTVILDVDTSLAVARARADLQVYLGGSLLSASASVRDALTIEAGERPEALVVVNERNEVKVLASLPCGSSNVEIRSAEGEFETEEQRTYTRTVTRTETVGDDDGNLDVDDVGDGDGDGRDDRDFFNNGNDTNNIDVEDPVVNVPGFGLGAGLLAVGAAAMLSLRRRL